VTTGRDLPRPRTAAGVAGLAAIRADPSGALVAVDFDGTLAPIVDDPATSRVQPGGIEALTAIRRSGARVAVITGRAAVVAVRLGGLQAVPGIVVLGQYGAERWHDGELTTPDPLPGLAAVRSGLSTVMADAEHGAWVEDKRLSLVVHTRPCTDPDAALRRLAPRIAALADANGLEADSGRYVVEIRPPGIDKGRALRALVGELRARAVLFAGDDVGDLPAFDVVEQLRGRGTAGVTVCSASTEVAAVAERADVVVGGTRGVVDFLEALGSAMSGEDAVTR